ncbi:MAG TPA: GntR family transcriptional regulator [Clostridia bacterium]|nr:GntR family transcriptional regulator [Clostridia bacterium]
MEFRRLSAPTLKELFVRELESMILSGKLPVGTQLPPERELATRMQVSRAVVNSGIADLARKGYLVIKPRAGTFVADYRRDGTIETFLSIVTYNGGRLRREELRSILELRIALDTLAVELCAARITDEEIVRLRASAEDIRQAMNPEEAVAHAFAFQHQLALYSGNALLPVIFSTFKSITRTLWLRFCALYGIPALYDNTNRLCEKLEARDFPGAIQSLTESVRESIDGERQIYY